MSGHLFQNREESDTNKNGFEKRLISGRNTIFST